MLGHDWNPSLAAHLGHIRTEKQRTKTMPVDFLDGIWGFDEFPPIPGMFSNQEACCKQLFIVQQPALYSLYQMH